MANIDYSKGMLFNNYGSNVTIPNFLAGNSANEAKNDDIPIIDKDWITSRFLISDGELDGVAAVNKYFSSAHYKITDTSLGGNIGINTRAGFTPYCDIPIAGKRNDRSFPSVTASVTTYGMGRYYSHAIDDNEQIVFLEFGVAKFNSMLDYFTKAVDYTDSVLANTGRKPYAYTAGKALGAGVMLAAFPLITLAIWTTKTITGLIASNNAFEYYYLETTMHTYWSTVNTIVTMLATEMGILVPELMEETAGDKKMGVRVKINQEDLNAIKALIPNLITGSNYIDVFAIATRAQSLANTQILQDKDIAAKKSEEDLDFRKYLNEKYKPDETSKSGMAKAGSAVNTAVMFTNYLNKTVNQAGHYYNDPDTADKPIDPASVSGVPSANNKDKKEVAKATRDTSDGTYPAPNDKKMDTLTKFASSLDAAVRDGGMFAAFRVDYTGSVSESFSNSTDEIDLGSDIKMLSKKSRDLRFSLSGGNIVGDTVNSAVGHVKDMLAGTLNSITYGASNVLQTFLGGGYLHMQKKWSDSDMSISNVTYTMQLISPYGNVISRMKNIYIPLSMLLAGTLPLSTGKASYTSPFLCSVFSKGVQNIKLGMITELSITRGTSNLGFNKNREALAIDVSFTVSDFSNILAAPINSSIFNGEFSAMLDDDNPFGRYVSVLGSRNLLTNKYVLPKIKLKYARLRMSVDKALSPAGWGLRVGESLNGILGGFVSQKALTNTGTL